MRIALVIGIFAILFATSAAFATNHTSGDPCTGITCNVQPSPTCDGNNLRVYNSTGTCSAGTCSYPYLITVCQHGCSNGACLQDACAGVTCNSPPSAVCEGSSTLKTYSSPGTCSAGTCSYSYTTTNCQYGCSNGVCLSGNATANTSVYHTPTTPLANAAVTVMATSSIAGTIYLYVDGQLTTCATATSCSSTLSSPSPGAHTYYATFIINGVSTTSSTYSFIVPSSSTNTTNSCTNIVCNTPTTNVCEGSSLRIYNSPGTCTNGVCSYTSYTTPCPYGCSNGQCNAATSGLIAYWKFNEGTSSIAYDTQGVYNLNINGATWSTDSQSGSSLSFDGSNDYAYNDNLFDISPASGTIDLWFKPGIEITAAHPNHIPILQKYNDNNNWVAIFFSQNDNRVDFSIGKAGARYDAYSLARTWNSNTWYRLTVTWGSKGMQVGVNGVLEGSNSFTGSMNSNNVKDFWLGSGAQWEMNWFWNGKLDEVKIYNTQNEISQPTTSNNTSPTQTNCIDTDGGMNYEKKGTVTYNLNYGTSYQYTLVDSCSGNSLNEYYCDAQGVSHTTYYTCPYGCSEGACKTSGTCYTGQVEYGVCPNGHKYEKRNCVSGRMVDINYFADPCMSATTPLYRYAKWTCGANYTTSQGSDTSCKDETTWRQQAVANCTGREVTYFAVDARCDGSTACQQVQCAAAPSGCYYADAKWENGCQTSCGRLVCPGTCNQNGICERGEEGGNCRDCLSNECPLTKKCEDGTPVTCYSNGFSCVCGICPIPANTIPFGCRQETDSSGFIRVVCDRYKPTCPAIDSSLKERCYSSGGMPEITRDPTGCEQIYCRFGHANQSFFGNAQCPTPDALSSALQKCESLGLRSVVAFENGCRIGRCVQEARQACQEPSREDIDACKNKGGGVMYHTDENGCRAFTCTDSQDSCSQDLPKESYELCARDGGQLIVKRDDNNCVAFTECVRRGDSSHAYVERINHVPDSSELLQMAFKMEDLRLDLDRLSRKSADIAEYYKTTASTDENRFRRVSDMFAAARDRVDEIRAKIRERVDKLTADDLTEIKSDIRYIKDVMIKDVLYVMLGSGDDIDKLKNGTTENCGRDEECFGRALRICQPVTFEPDGGITVKITGLEDKKCVMTAALGSNDMTCRIEKYSLGIKNPETDIFPHCTGSLVEIVKSMSQDREASTDRIAVQDPARTSGESCQGCFDNGVCDRGECSTCGDCS